MTLVLSMVVPGQPVGKGRPRVTRTGTTFTPARTVAFERLVGLHARRVSRAPVTGPLRLEVVAVFERPQRDRELRGLEGRVPCARGGGRYPDADNVLKAVADALQGVAYGNDSQLAEVQASRVFGRPGEGPATEVRLWSL